MDHQSVLILPADYALLNDTARAVILCARETGVRGDPRAPRSVNLWGHWTRPISAPPARDTQIHESTGNRDYAWGKLFEPSTGRGKSLSKTMFRVVRPPSTSC